MEERPHMMGKVELSFELLHPSPAGLPVALSLRLSAVRISASVCLIVSLAKPESHATAVESREISEAKRVNGTRKQTKCFFYQVFMEFSRCQMERPRTMQGMVQKVENVCRRWSHGLGKDFQMARCKIGDMD